MMNTDELNQSFRSSIDPPVKPLCLADEINLDAPKEQKELISLELHNSNN